MVWPSSKWTTPRRRRKPNLRRRRSRCPVTRQNQVRNTHPLSSNTCQSKPHRDIGLGPSPPKSPLNRYSLLTLKFFTVEIDRLDHGVLDLITAVVGEADRELTCVSRFFGKRRVLPMDLSEK